MTFIDFVVCREDIKSYGEKILIVLDRSRFLVVIGRQTPLATFRCRARL
ncbi:MAG: hypothetical protein JETT_0170 [Candidatus Jettenia ecosi]|uniref:Uncharacterized protein n=1 Tax=Candidatus Jettenia ecosi TaxID=2494326 RepID=A0A533QFV8_9BACT|nr:MAG: hypothetical protein JETT_0170 [Candidatus Jettenia ecosi]